MTVLTEIFGAPLTAYGLWSALALLVLLGITLLRSSLRGIPLGRLLFISCMSVVLGWLCSRLVFVLASIEFYFTELEAPAYALRFWDGGYSMLGMGLGLMLAVWLGTRLFRLPAALMLDDLSIGMAPALMLARLAERGTGLGVGLPIDQGWPTIGILTETEYGTMHAVWAYEMIAAGITLLAVVTVARAAHRRNGDLMLTFTLVFSALQVLLESFRDDGHMEIHMGIHVQQVICAVLLCVPVIVWAVRAARRGLTRTKLTVLLLLCGIGIGLAILAEFGVDRWSSKLLAYGLMTGCLLFIAGCGLWLRRKAAD